MKDKKLYVGIGIVAIIVVGILIYFLNYIFVPIFYIKNMASYYKNALKNL